ncbi:hypothetical protein BV22DRAFT_724760 [Leucogyrophana mollusca]|uniref:Uncharacterized protein n=1 Tax=Leucogyrophana mollusca TaxID=85980 RepID=A0ACB8B8I4_9AGAM|nr:hypothetical protein BV22DRAFT_724760 [Leucogyrophana mollusca]
MKVGEGLGRRRAGDLWRISVVRGGRRGAHGATAAEKFVAVTVMGGGMASTGSVRGIATKPTGERGDEEDEAAPVKTAPPEECGKGDGYVRRACGEGGHGILRGATRVLCV